MRLTALVEFINRWWYLLSRLSWLLSAIAPVLPFLPPNGSRGPFLWTLPVARIQAEWVCYSERLIPHIPNQVPVPRTEPNRILAQPLARARIIPPVEVVL